MRQSIAIPGSKLGTHQIDETGRLDAHAMVLVNTTVGSSLPASPRPSAEWELPSTSTGSSEVFTQKWHNAQKTRVAYLPASIVN